MLNIIELLNFFSPLSKNIFLNDFSLSYIKNNLAYFHKPAYTLTINHNNKIISDIYFSNDFTLYSSCFSAIGSAKYNHLIIQDYKFNIYYLNFYIYSSKNFSIIKNNEVDISLDYQLHFNTLNSTLASLIRNYTFI